MNIDLNIDWLPWQHDFFLGDTSRFKLCRKGRRLGFTRGCAQFVVKSLVEGRYSRIMWGDTVLGNIEKYMERYFMPVLKQLPDNIWQWHKQEKMLTVAGNTCDFRSADQPEKWEGFGYGLIVLNEAGIILRNSYLYDNAVRPMLLDNPKSELICGGTPKGKKHKGIPHRFYELVVHAESTKDPKWKTFSYSTFDNPMIEEKEIHDMIAESSEAVSRQEIYGEFLSSDAAVLIDSELIQAGIDRNAEYSEYRSAPKVMGIDVGWANDPTVIVKRQGVKVFEPSEIENSRDDTITASRIAVKIREWSPDLVCIDYGYGTGVVSILNSMGFQVQGIHFGESALDPAKYANRRSEMYDKIRISLAAGLDIPDHAKLQADLGAIGVGHDAKGRLLLEKKELIKAKLGRSTDFGDALSLTKAAPVIVSEQLKPEAMTYAEREQAFITGQLVEDTDIQDVMVQ